MRKIRAILLSLIWLIPSAFLCYFLITFKTGSIKLKDGVYRIINNDLEWEVQISNGVFKSNLLKNRKTKEYLALNGEDFSIKVGFKKDIGWIKNHGKQVHGSYSAVNLTSRNCTPIELIRGKDFTGFIFYHRPLRVFLYLKYTHTKEERIIHRNLSLISYNAEELVVEEAILGNWTIEEKLSGGGIGLPVFVNDYWFFSGEEPWVGNIVSSNKLFLIHYPSAYIKNGEKWTSDSMAIGGGTQDAKLILKDYINSVILPPRFFSLYNTWYDLRENDLSLANVITNFMQLTNKLNQFGENIDYCVIDDGWFFKDTLYGTNTNTFPNDLKEISDIINPLKSNLGLWLPFSGLYLDNAGLRQFGYEEANSKFYCLSGTNYYSALSKRLYEIITHDHVAFFKHDFNFFDCMIGGHGHLRNLIHSREMNMRQTSKLLDFERKCNPKIIQAVTTGINLSPWWLKYAHILWMGGGDVDFETKFPVTSRAEAEMTYRDGKLYEILREKNTFFPLYAIMTHGIIDGRLNSVGPWLNHEQWSDYIMNYFGRGTAIRELYLYAPKLNQRMSETLAKGLSWANEHNKQMLNAEMILGDPRKNEIYGFRGYDDKGKCYVSIRNPKFIDEEISLQEIVLNSRYYKITYPYQRVFSTESSPNLKIPAESVIILESLSKTTQSDISDQEITKKILISNVNIEGNDFSFDLDVPNDTTVDLVITTKNKTDLKLIDNNVPIDKIKMISFNGSIWKVDIVTFSSGIHKITGNFSTVLTSKDIPKLQIRANYTSLKETYDIN